MCHCRMAGALPALAYRLRFLAFVSGLNFKVRFEVGVWALAVLAAAGFSLGILEPITPDIAGLFGMRDKRINPAAKSERVDDAP